MALGLAIFGALVGVALGLRFKVLILVPAIGFAAVFALVVGLANGDTFGSILLAIVIVGIAIQFGYLAGIFLANRIR
jgi:hypothetical protein